jgi:hypothetical protein
MEQGKKKTSLFILLKFLAKKLLKKTTWAFLSKKWLVGYEKQLRSNSDLGRKQRKLV